MLRQADVEKAITWFNETRSRKALALLVHPLRVSVEAQNESGWLFSIRGVHLYLDETVPLADEDGEILFLLGDCIEPAVRIRPEP